MIWRLQCPKAAQTDSKTVDFIADVQGSLQANEAPRLFPSPNNDLADKNTVAIGGTLGKSSNEKTIIVSFSNGDPESPFNWPNVKQEVPDLLTFCADDLDSGENTSFSFAASSRS